MPARPISHRLSLHNNKKKRKGTHSWIMKNKTNEHPILVSVKHSKLKSKTRKNSMKKPQIIIKDHLITNDGKEVKLTNTENMNLEILKQLTDEKIGTSQRFQTRRDVAKSIFRRLIAQRTFNQKKLELQKNCRKWERLAEKYNDAMKYDFNIHAKCRKA